MANVMELGTVSPTQKHVLSIKVKILNWRSWLLKYITIITLIQFYQSRHQNPALICESMAIKLMSLVNATKSLIKQDALQTSSAIGIHRVEIPVHLFWAGRLYQLFRLVRIGKAYARSRLVSNVIFWRPKTQRPWWPLWKPITKNSVKQRWVFLQDHIQILISWWCHQQQELDLVKIGALMIIQPFRLETQEDQLHCWDAQEML